MQNTKESTHRSLTGWPPKTIHERPPIGNGISGFLGRNYVLEVVMERRRACPLLSDVAGRGVASVREAERVDPRSMKLSIDMVQP